ncbi:DUF4192 family protein [Paeniglutamicibacter cryotolerans]|uniref:DUF4192 domain-containing protein n=1 Tax=Paeniglutamicibacter cryotolerans TaxID=670079 RepID=A0A839QUC6_9MICC|nr:DUF4192 family protein [Paeniglutamicibacter cryotolerans]MBB2997566.1 hypothetical protein [Paeniglutamicibacter cryotolerans]
MDKITASTSIDLIAVAVHALGFTPTSSVVLMLLEDHALSATLRLDADPGVPAGAWASVVGGYVQQVSSITGVMLLSFEDERAMSPAQYRALDLVLTVSRCPIRGAVRIRDGFITEYTETQPECPAGNQPGTPSASPAHHQGGKVPVGAVALCTTALELMASTTCYAKLAADIPPYDPTQTKVSELQRSREEASGLDAGHRGTRTMVCARLIGLVMGYQCTGTITPEQGAWLAGMCTNKGIRDLLFGFLATTEDEMDSIGAVLLGERAPDDWEFFTDGADAIYAALEYVPPQDRVDLLAGLGWTRWIQGKGTEAMNFLNLAQSTDPTHRLTVLLMRLITDGHLPVSAITKH